MKQEIILINGPLDGFEFRVDNLTGVVWIPDASKAKAVSGYVIPTSFPLQRYALTEEIVNGKHIYKYDPKGKTE